MNEHKRRVALRELEDSLADVTKERLIKSDDYREALIDAYLYVGASLSHASRLAHTVMALSHPDTTPSRAAAITALDIAGDKKSEGWSRSVCTRQMLESLEPKQN